MKCLALILLFSSLVFAHEIKIEVSLNPAGSFIAQSGQLKVEKLVRQNKDGFSLSKAELSLSSLSTGIELRDRHMKENYFEVSNYPQAELFKTSGKEGRFKGNLKVHGVTKAIQGTYELDSQTLKAEFFCKLSDFKIKKANYRGIGVEDQVKVRAEVKIQ